MTTERSIEAQELDEMSRSNDYCDPKKAAFDFVNSVFEQDALAAIEELRNDPSWSQDREPYLWLDAVEHAIKTWNDWAITRR